MPPHYHTIETQLGGPPTEPSPAAQPEPVGDELGGGLDSHQQWADGVPVGPAGPLPPDRGNPSSTDQPGAPWRRWVLPAALVLGVVGGAAGALVLDDHAEAEAAGTTATETPVMSPRRAPELLTAPRAEQRLVSELDGWVTDLPPDSCLVVSQAGAPLFELNPDQPLPGASTQKIVTSTAVLLAGDPDDQFETVAASTGTLANGVLSGDLYVIGGGDPLLTSDDYLPQIRRGEERVQDVGDLADAIADAGITHIQGSVIGDESRYDADRFHAAWPDRFRSQNQIGPVSALNVNDGFAEYPEAWSGLESKVPAADPAANAAAVITNELERRGVTVDGAAQSGSAPESAQAIASLSSASLHDLSTQMLMDSDNDTAEMLLKELGLELGGAGTWEAGAEAAATVLTQAGVDLEGLSIVDGSGLSEQNRLSCTLLVDLLTHPETGQLVVDGLAVAGESGTLENRWNGTEAEGRVLGKTGSLRNVSSLAGQVKPTDGGTLTYAFVSTVPEPGELPYTEVPEFVGLGDILVDHSAGVDLAELLPVDYPSEAPADDEADDEE